MNRIILMIIGLFSTSSLLLVDSAIKGAALLLLAAIAAMLLKRDSAATRHLMWLLAIVAMLVLPVLSAMLPQWRILPQWTEIAPQKLVVAVATNPQPIATPVIPPVELPRTAGPINIEPPSAPQRSAAAEMPVPKPMLAAAPTAPKPVASTWKWFDSLPLIWAIGFSLLILRLIAARLLLWNAQRQATIISSNNTDDSIVAALQSARSQLKLARPVALLTHPDRTIPVVWGVFRCRLLLPESARDWINEQLQSVLLHELAHVKRRDLLAQLLTQLACAVHWFNPLVWLAAWRLGVERERACDDLVLSSGVRPSAYAGHLLEIVTALSPSRWTHSCGLAMARKSSIEGRLVAVLSKNLNRRGVSMALAAIALAIAASIAVPTAMLRAADRKPAAPMQPEPRKSEYVRGLDLSKVPVQGYRAAQNSLPDLYVPDPANPGSYNYPKNVFLMPLTDDTWLQYPAGSAHFYIGLRREGTPDGEQIYGPIAGDPFDVLKLDELFRERLKPGSTSDNARYRLRLMFRTGEPGLVRRAWRMIEPELAFKFTPRDENFYQRFELFEGVRDALRDRAEEFRNPELKDIAAQATQRVKAAEAEFDELNGLGNDADTGTGYESATYLQPKIAAKIPESLWGKPLDGLRLALVPRQSTPGIDWNELPSGTPMPASITAEPRQELNYQLVVENVSDHEIKLCGYVGGEEVHRTLEVLDGNGKPADIQGLHTSIISIPSYWRLKPGERYLLSMPAVHFMPAKSGNPNQGMGYFVKSAPGEYTLRCSYVFGLYDNTRHRHIPEKGIWVGQLTTASQKITLAAPAGENVAAPKELEKSKEGIKLQPELEQKLKWGKMSNGLRAALVIRNLPDKPDAKPTPDLYLLIQNMSDAPIHLTDTISAPKLRSLTLYRDDLPQGRTVLNEPTQANVILQPREATYLLMCPRAKTSRGQALAAGMLKETHMILVGQISLEKAPAGAWTGELFTGQTGGVDALIEEADAPKPADAPKAADAPRAPTAKLDAALEQNLMWGAPVNGLRAAVAARPSAEKPKPGDLPEFYLVVQNVSNAPIQITDASVPADVRTRELIHKKDGRILYIAGARQPAFGDITLQPLEAAFQPMFDPVTKMTAPADPTVDKHTLGQTMIEGVLKDAHETLAIRMVIEKAPAGAWTGKLITGDATGYMALAQPQPKDKQGQTLYRLWHDHTRLNGNFPGGLIARLAVKVNEFIKNNTGDASGDPYAKKMAPIVPRLDSSRDWKSEEVIALFDDIAAVTPIPLETTLEQTLAQTFKAGSPLPRNLTGAPWGKPQPNGLRMAWLLEPRAVEYPLNTPLKSRILIHNTGKDAVVFRTRMWHQGGHKAQDADGKAIKVDSIFWMTIGQLTSYRLWPGEYVELYATGVGIGPMKTIDDSSNIRVGSSIEAKAGDDVTVSTGPVPMYDWNELPPKTGQPAWWVDLINASLAQNSPIPADADERKRFVYRAGMDLFGTPLAADEIASFANDRDPNALDSLAKRLANRPGQVPFSGDLTSATTKFRVLPPDPDAAKRPRAASNPGQYPLGGFATLVVTRRPDGDRIINQAHLSFANPIEPIPRANHEIKLPDGYNTWSAAWVRDSNVLWVMQNGTVRSYDFSNLDTVKETPFEDPANFDKAVPKPILDALRAAVVVPVAPGGPAASPAPAK